MTPGSGRLPKQGLYAITDGRQGAALLAAVAAALEGGAALLQYRDKTTEHSRRYHEAHELLKLCRDHAVPLIINDDVALCGELGADGVHLGHADVTPSAARSALGPQAIIGLSCYNALPRAAAAASVDYLAFGAFYPSPTKPQALRAETSLLRQARAAYPPQRLSAIGGIAAVNAQPLIAAGADYLAVISGVFGAADITQAARTIAALFQQRSA
ncbi:MAG: thiamine phosphate synthase [Nevskiales bacterium]